MSDYLRSLGAVVRATRERQGLSMTDLAAATDADPALLRALEQGEAGPTYLLLLRVADALGTPASELVVLAEQGKAE
jgi:transcriptional regulator with XRE-family HTH domain